MSATKDPTAVTGDPGPPGEANPPETWNQPAQPTAWSHQLLIVRPSDATANTSRCSGKRATTEIGVRARASRTDSGHSRFQMTWRQTRQNGTLRFRILQSCSGR